MNKILTDYYRMEHLPGTKSKSRMDCTLSTKSYPELETLRNKAGKLFFYFHDVPEHFHARAKRKADKAITKTKSISSVYIPEITLPLGYGDIKGSQDALVFVFNEDFTRMDVFVARGQRNNRISLYNLLADGELDEEMEELQVQAQTEKEPDLLTTK
ncbi:hypothetical protein [Marinilabilia salmonicolor]|uniref:Uncharacterized protein n=1 Tax=Marinilabilia salmonicolor TaxID=989 RepID=A0A368UTL7_9BACT|nr:hypothetical protein [Marinilabilia salmonicolor]RCW31380.1 hypothetical protein DFO77_11897 [Marinilabilia salmonicolor]